jgi:hypothetical protein
VAVRRQFYSVTHSIMTNDMMTVNDDMKSMWMQAVVAYVKLSSYNFTRGTEESNEKLQPGLLVPRP